MSKITGSQIEELTMVDLGDQKETLKILSERDYIKCVELNLEADDPYLECEWMMKTDSTMILTRLQMN